MILSMAMPHKALTGLSCKYYLEEEKNGKFVFIENDIKTNKKL
jgi:hypothetical protein